jgi:hypothetical protein
MINCSCISIFLQKNSERSLSRWFGETPVVLELSGLIDIGSIGCQVLVSGWKNKTIPVYVAVQIVTNVKSACITKTAVTGKLAQL